MNISPKREVALKHMGTILVLADEPSVLAVIHAVLVGDGHEVVGATNVQSDVDFCKDTGRQIDAIVADVMARGPFDGSAAQEMFARRHGVPILLMSGHRLEDLIEQQFICPQNLELGRVRFLQKPFRPDVLRVEIRRLLEAKPARRVRAYKNRESAEDMAKVPGAKLLPVAGEFPSAPKGWHDASCHTLWAFSR